MYPLIKVSVQLCKQKARALRSSVFNVSTYLYKDSVNYANKKQILPVVLEVCNFFFALESVCQSVYYRFAHFSISTRSPIYRIPTLT
jgi:hypothetical protein